MTRDDGVLLFPPHEWSSEILNRRQDARHVGEIDQCIVLLLCRRSFRLDNGEQFFLLFVDQVQSRMDDSFSNDSSYCEESTSGAANSAPCARSA